jgi:hypothetical protein
MIPGVMLEVTVMNKLLVTVAFVLALFPPGLVLAQEPGGLPDILSEEQMTRMGLHKLSPDEQQQLFEWITGNGEAVAPFPAPATGAMPAAATTAGSAPLPDTPAPATAAPAAAASINAVDPAVASAADADASFGKAKPRPDQMRSFIPGRFTGWTGDTLFTLNNGQVWQQRYETTWRTEMTDPEVVIKRHFLGLHRMEVVGTGQTVPVKRIR